MVTLLTTIHIVVAVFMILVVLVQGGNQGGVGAAFGGGNSQGVFGASGATSFLGKLTYWAAFIFMCTSISLTIMMGRGGTGRLEKKLEQVTNSSTTTAGLAKPATEPKTVEAKTEAPKADVPKTEAVTPAAAEPKK